MYVTFFVAASHVCKPRPVAIITFFTDLTSTVVYLIFKWEAVLMCISNAYQWLEVEVIDDMRALIAVGNYYENS